MTHASILRFPFAISITRRSRTRLLSAFTLSLVGACDPVSPQMDVPEPLPCQGAVAVPNGELTLTRTKGPPNSASLQLPTVDSLCITLTSHAASAEVTLDGATLWSPAFFKNKAQTSSVNLDNLDGQTNTLHASISGKPGSHLELKAYYGADVPMDGSGPATPDEALLIGEAFIKYHHDTYTEIFAAWDGAHAVKVTELRNAEGSVEAFELSVETAGGMDAGYLVLERDPLRPILGSAALEGPPLTQQLVAAYAGEYGESPVDDPNHRFLWGGAALMALETGEGGDAKRVATCDTCIVTYANKDRPDVERAEMGLSDEAWIAERKLKLKRMLDHLMMGGMGDALPKQGDILGLADVPSLGPPPVVSAPSQEPSPQMLCPLQVTNEVPGGKGAFNHYWQVHDVEGVNECRWAQYDTDDKVCGWSGCMPIAAITLLDYWDKRYPFLLPYHTLPGAELSMDDPNIVDAINELRIAMQTVKLWDVPVLDDQALTWADKVPLLDNYIDARAGKDAGWTVENHSVQWDLNTNERLKALKHEIDAGYPPILQFPADSGDEGWPWKFKFADHGVVAVNYVDDGDSHEDNDMVGVLYGWKNTETKDYFYLRQHIVPVSGIGLMWVTSVRPDCTGKVAGDLCAQFEDIPDDHWGKTSAETLACRCVIRGHADGKFGVNDTITKAEFLKMVIMLAFNVNLDGERVDSEGGKVCSSHWASGYIDFAYQKDMLGAPILSEGKFEPDQPITRQEAAFLVVEAGKHSGFDTFQALNSERQCFALHDTANPYEELDGDSVVGTEYLAHVLAATSKCVFEGYKPSKENPHQSFKPTNTISRIEATKVACVARFGFDSPLCDQNYDCVPLVVCDE